MIFFSHKILYSQHGVRRKFEYILRILRSCSILIAVILVPEIPSKISLNICKIRNCSTDVPINVYQLFNIIIFPNFLSNRHFHLHVTGIAIGISPPESVVLSVFGRCGCCSPRLTGWWRCGGTRAPMLVSWLLVLLLTKTTTTCIQPERKR